MPKPRTFFSRERKVQTVHRIVSELHREGVIRHSGSEGDGARWQVDGARLHNFGFCSYMGLERHPMLMKAAQEALASYGTSTSISRIFVDCPLYRRLEELLSQLMQRHVIATPSTTLAHLAALPVLVGDRDLVLVDQFAHASIHMATELINDVPIELVRHSRLDVLERRIQAADPKVERIWYLCDGIYSMLGDLAPFAGLNALLERYPKLHLYVDDAHAMSWTGRFGRGAALSQLSHLDRVVVAVSLSKAFGASGGALALPSAELTERVRYCGGPMLFSGPLAPASLGAAVASAELHLSTEFESLQDELHERIRYTRAALDAAGLQCAVDSVTPIFMIHYDSPARAAAVVRGLRERGFFCCPSTFPAVPINKPSIRFTVSRHNGYDDIAQLVANLAEVSADVGGASAELALSASS